MHSDHRLKQKVLAATSSQKYTAKTAAGRVKGVKALAKEIEAQSPLRIRHGKKEIAAADLNRLMCYISVQGRDQGAGVKKFMPLTDNVDQYYQKDTALSVRPVIGV